MSRTTPPQPDLFDWTPPPGLERKFHEYDQANPEVWQMFKRFTFELIGRGVRHYSADAVLHRIRWETTLQHGDGSGFKCNNNFTALYARRFAREFPQYRDFFSFRRSKVDGPRGPFARAA